MAESSSCMATFGMLAEEVRGGMFGMKNSSLAFDTPDSCVEVDPAARAALKLGSSQRSEPMLGRLRGAPDCVCRRFCVPDLLRRTGD